MIKRSSRAVAFWRGAIRPVSACTSLDCSLSYWWGLCWRWQAHLMYKITGPAEGKLCLSSRKQQAFRPLLTDRRQILPICSFPETPHPAVCSLWVQRAACHLACRGTFSTWLWAQLSSLEKGCPVVTSSVLLAEAGASVAPREGRNCACVLWFGEQSGEWPQVWGEEYVPLESPIFIPLTKP